MASPVEYDALLFKHGQTWIAEQDVVAAGYSNTLGEIILVKETRRAYELAGRVAPFKVGLKFVDGLVWWLQQVTFEPTDTL